jgi:hypothetical protein
VDERDLAAQDPPPRPLVDELRPSGREAGELGADVVDFERHVMQPRAPVGEELPDRGFRTLRRQQLDSTVTDAEECDIGTLLVHGLAQLDLGAEQAPVRLDCPLEVVDRDPDVMEPADRHAGDATARSAP